MDAPLHLRYPRSSSFYAYSNCDISFELMQASGEEPPNEFSDRGTETHGVLSGKVSPKSVDDATVDLAAELHASDAALANKLYVRSDLDEERVEERLWLREGLQPIYSGQPDRWRVFDHWRGVYLVDYKTGWHPLDGYVATNCQIRSYVPLLDDLYDNKIKEVIAAIHKPGKKLPPTVFDRKEIDYARQWAVEVAARVSTPGPKEPNRGPWCKYCSGKVLCPAWRPEIEALSDRAFVAIGDIPDLVLREMAPRLSLAKTVIEKLLARLEARVKDRPDVFSDWRFDPGVSKRNIEKDKNVKVFDILVTKTQSLSFDEFLRSAKLSVTDVEDFVRLNRKIGRKTAIAFLAEQLKGLLEKTSPKPQLVYDPGWRDQIDQGQPELRLSAGQDQAEVPQNTQAGLERQDAPDLEELIRQDQREQSEGRPSARGL